MYHYSTTDVSISVRREELSPEEAQLRAECEAIKEEIAGNHTTKGWAEIDRRTRALGEAWDRFIEKEDLYYEGGTVRAEIPGRASTAAGSTDQIETATTPAPRPPTLVSTGKAGPLWRWRICR